MRGCAECAAIKLLKPDSCNPFCSDCSEERRRRRAQEARIEKLIAPQKKKKSRLAGGGFGDGVGRPRSGKKLFLFCKNRHRWPAEYDERGEKGERILNGTCTTCGNVAIDEKLTKFEYKEGVPCAKNCWNATEDRCECSCSATNHGRDAYKKAA